MSNASRALLKVAATAVLGLSSPVLAAIDAPIPSNAHITFNGLDWAWGSPVQGTADDLVFQGTQGWRFPTAAELLTAPTATMFLFAGANVPFNGTDPLSGATFEGVNSDYTNAQSAGACATPYFRHVVRGINDFYSECDWNEGLGEPFGPWSGMDGAETNGFAEQLYVRIASVPEPGTWAMMLLGFAGIGVIARQRALASPQT